MSTETETTLMDDVRRILRSAGGPMTAREIRDTLGDDTTSGGVGSSLHVLVKRGEVVHDRDVYPGTYTLAAPGATKGDSAVPATHTAAVADPPPATAQAATGGARERKPRATKPKGAGKRQVQKRTAPPPAEVGLGRRATRKQLRSGSAPRRDPEAAAPPPAPRSHVVAVPTADTPPAEQLVRLAACVIATWPAPLSQMPAQLAAQCNQALGLPEAA